MKYFLRWILRFLKRFVSDLRNVVLRRSELELWMWIVF